MADSHRGPGVRTNIHLDSLTNASIAGQNRSSALPLGRGGIGSGGNLLADTDTFTRLWDAVDYPDSGQLDAFDYHRVRFERQPEAHGLITKLAADTWGSDTPEVTDSIEQAGDDGGPTEFEKAVEKLFHGGSKHTSRSLTSVPTEDGQPADATGLRKSAHSRLETFDTLGILGQYAILVLGFADDSDLDESLTKDQFDGFDDLAYLQPYDQGRVEDIELVEDMHDPRYQLPEAYHVKVSDETTEEIHQSRVIHLAHGGAINEEIRGEFALKSIMHPLLNIEKIHAAAAEGYWRGAYQGLVIKPPSDADGVPMTFSDTGQSTNGTSSTGSTATDMTAAGAGAGDNYGDVPSPEPQQPDQGGSMEVRREIAQWRENLQRTIATTGDVETLDSQVESPIDHLAAQMRSIAADWDIPQSILMGNETGERATQEDRRMWHEKVANRRQIIAEERILRPLIDRLVAVGVLPSPDHEDGSYEIDWPALDEPTEMERAEIFNQWASGVANITADQPDLLGTWAEYREEFLGWDAERGSEAPESTDSPATPETPMPEGQSSGMSGEQGPEQATRHVPESGRRTAAPAERARANETSYSEGDIVATPSGRGVIVATKSSTFEFPQSDEGEGSNATEEIDASSSRPAYVVGFGGRSAVFRGSALAQTSLDDDAQTTTDSDTNALATVSSVDVTSGDLPQGWSKESVISFYASMRGSFTDMVDKLTEEMSEDQAKRIAGRMKSYVTGTQRWRSRW